MHGRSKAAIMEKNFRSLVQFKKVKWPTERGYNTNRWNNLWKNSSENNDNDYGLFLAGDIFHEILSELRNELNAIYEKAPKINNEKLIQAYCGISNRDRYIISQPDMNDLSIKSLQAQTVSNNRFGIELTYQEIADGCVDSIRNAIAAAINRKKDLNVSSTPYDPLEFMQREMDISQLYELYESYWQALVWADYEFSLVDSEQKIYELSQPRIRPEVIHEITQIRKMKLYGHSSSIASKETFHKYFDSDKYIAIEGGGKSKTAKSKLMKHADKKIKIINSCIQIEIKFLEDSFPVELLSEVKQEFGFSIYECLQVFRLLVILSHLLTDNFPDKDNVFVYKKLFEFSPKFKKNLLIKSVSTSLGLKYNKIKKIIGFLTFNGKPNEDLWCFPVINISHSELTFVTSALSTPLLQRVVEHWLVKMDADIAKKGTSFEKHIINEINTALETNHLLNNFDCASSKRFKLDSGEEEIDIIFRLGNKVLVGEVKCIVTTDSPISYYRTIKTLEKASAQANRKKDFAAKNLKETFSAIGWDYHDHVNYEVLPFVLSSNHIHAGFSVHDIPVCDEKIITKYLSTNIIPLLSMDGDKHAIWFEVYSDQTTAENNIFKYLNHPPQITRTEDDFDEPKHQIPYLSESSYKILHSRLIPKYIDLDIILNREHYFQICYSKDYRDVIKEADIFF